MIIRRKYEVKNHGVLQWILTESSEADDCVGYPHTCGLPPAFICKPGTTFEAILTVPEGEQKNG